MTRVDPRLLARGYVIVLGVGLLLEGGALQILQVLSIEAPFNTSDTVHNFLHVIWGLALLAATYRGYEVWAALFFGAFYIALGVVGLTVEHPFGMQLGPGENVFHFTVGPLALAVGAWSFRSTTALSAAPVPSRTATRPGGVRTSPAARRRAPRRRGNVRGGRRRR